MSLFRRRIIQEKADEIKKKCLCFEFLEGSGGSTSFYFYIPSDDETGRLDSDVSWDELVFYYSINDGPFYKLTETTDLPSVEKGDKMYFYGDNETWSWENFRYICSSNNNIWLNPYCNCKVSGQIQTIINIDLPRSYNFECCYYELFGGTISIIDASKLLLSTTTESECYYQMFESCAGLTEAPELPATTLATYCYENMFWGCESLTKAPELPATKLANGCYADMFSGCIGLTEAPELPATELAENCYFDMFWGCTSLTKAPELPATTLATYCYEYMFCGCESLTEAPELPATILATYCYNGMFYGCTSLTEAPVLPATTLANYCYEYMFDGCTSLTEAPSILPATTLTTGCYNSMFYGCTSLIEAPVLPATNLIQTCYAYMFYKCTKLSYVKALFTTTPGYTYTNNWLYGVASSGTFVKNSKATWSVSGTSGIPSGWTVQTATS